MTDWNEHEDAIDDAISDSIDMDWTSRTGAKAVVAWLNENAAAPAPSSLAGGEVTNDQIQSVMLAAIKEVRATVTDATEGACMDADIIRMERGLVDMGDTGWAVMRSVHRRLAALSPEAPAREGVVMAATDVPMWADGIATDGENVAMVQKAETDHGGHYWAVDGGNGGLDWEPTHFISLDALTPRHEAPAEGAGEREEIAHEIYDFLNERFPDGALPGGVQLFADADDHTDADMKHEAGCDELAGRILALRARSSAPEAREEALGNLLAVIHGDGGHRALEVGTKQAALEAEKIVARLLSSAPEAREGDQPFSYAYRYPDPMGGTVVRLDTNGREINGSKPIEAIALYTHPAAPSADKLRIAVEALEPFANLGVTSGPNDEPCHFAYRITRGAIRNARQALATLKAEGGK